MKVAAQKNAFALFGAALLLLGVWNFLSGDDWVVWIILGILFGGLGVFRRKSDSEGSDS